MAVAPLTASEALSRSNTFKEFNKLVRKQQVIPEISGELISNQKIKALRDYAVSKTVPTMDLPQVPRESTYVAKPRMEKGGPIKHRGWEYKQENNEIYARKEGQTDWTIPQGQAREAIIKRHYPNFGSAPTINASRAQVSNLTPIGRVTPEVQANLDRSIAELAAKQSSGFGQGNYTPTVVGPEVPVVGKPLHPQLKFFNYQEPEQIEKIGSMQQEAGLEVDKV